MKLLYLWLRQMFCGLGFRADCSNPTYFSRIAHPIHGLRLRTVNLLDVSLQDMLFADHNINSGYIVDEVWLYSIQFVYFVGCW